MNERFPSVAIVLVLALCLLNCEAANRPPTQQDSPAKAESTTPKSPQEHAAVTWPPLPQVVLSPYLIDTDQLSRVGAGDSLALPLAGGFQTLTLKASLKDGVLGVQDLKVQTKDITGKGMSLVVRSLHTHDPKGNQASFVWHELTAVPDGGVALDLVGAFDSGSLVGYKYDLAALGALSPGNRMVLLDEEGWRVVEVRAPLESDILDVEDFKVSSRSDPIIQLRTFDSRDGKVGLIWDSPSR